MSKGVLPDKADNPNSSTSVLAKYEKLEKKVDIIKQKLSDFTDSYDELDETVQSLYDTVNSIKSKQLPSQASTTGKPKGSLHRKAKMQKLTTNTNINTVDDYDTDYDEDYDEDYSTDNENSLPIDGNYTSLSEYIMQYMENTAQWHAIPHHIILENCTKLLTLLKLSFTEQQTIPLIDHFISLELEHQHAYIAQLQTINSDLTAKIPQIFKVLNSSLSLYQKKLLLAKLAILNQMNTDDPEYFKLQQWITLALDIPINKFKTPSYQMLDTDEQRSEYLTNAQRHLDKVIFGQRKTKAHIIEIIAKMMNNVGNILHNGVGSASASASASASGSTFAIFGEPGTGKTSLIKYGLATLLELPFVFISLGGATDAAFLNGMSYTYVGSTPGKIVNILKQVQCMNPIFYFDELDKVSTTERGTEIINLLIHLTDPTQNTHFTDNYLECIELDLSRATFIFSFNDIGKVSPILRDRMSLIRFNSYTPLQKTIIAKRYLAPQICKEFLGIRNAKYTIVFSRRIMKLIIYKKERKCGVRYIKQQLEKIIARLNVCLIKNEIPEWFKIGENGKIIIV